jgi:glucose/arabinose dehydrogenase
VRNPRRAVLPALVAALLAVAACNGGDVDDVGEPPALPEETDDEEGEPPPDDGDEVDATAPPEVDVVATGLEAPWDVAFTSEGTAYVTERDAGRVLRVDDDGGTEEVRTFDVEPRGEGGLLGLTADPDGERLYAYCTS